MSKQASVKISILVLAVLLLTSCTVTGKTKTAEGECKLFDDPGFAVQGARPQDQRVVSRWQETGIAACEWKRPKPSGNS